MTRTIKSLATALAGASAGFVLAWWWLRRRQRGLAEEARRLQHDLRRREAELAQISLEARQLRAELARAQAEPALAPGHMAAAREPSAPTPAAPAPADLDTGEPALFADLTIESLLPLPEVQVLEEGAAAEAMAQENAPGGVDLEALRAGAGAAELAPNAGAGLPNQSRAPERVTLPEALTTAEDLPSAADEAATGVRNASPAVTMPAAADDLTRLEGIGPKRAALLRQAGITTFAQLAACDEATLQRIIQAPAWRRPSYADWIAQARLAASGDHEGLKALQDRLFRRPDPAQTD